MSKAMLQKRAFMKMWETNPKVWKFIINVGLLMKFKTLNERKLPHVINLASSHKLYINPSENRGRALLIKDGVTQKRLHTFWKKAVADFCPSLVIDIGVNYGECIFSTRYPNDTCIIGIEANPYLHPYIKRSQVDHSNAQQIRIVQAFVGDVEKENQLFYIDKHWSGTSSGTYAPTHNMVEPISVSTITIDSLVHTRDLSDDTLLFKIDVEGYESFVLKGMNHCLMQCKKLLGFIEFDSEYIKKSGQDLDEFLAFLNKYFVIYMYNQFDDLIEISNRSYTDITYILKEEEIHTDFILASNNQIVHQLFSISRG
ncbi:FkbM family methyltransferase [Priestia megaterium]|nr:FkbM family methyltransferase [Priestia megaterium]